MKLNIIGWTQSGEHYQCVYATWFDDSSSSVIKRLIGFSVPDLPETAEEAEVFGFAAEDIGDVLNNILLRIGKGFENLEFISADNTNVNPRLADLVTDYLQSRGIDRVIPLVGCAAHRLNLGVKSYYEDPKNPNSPKGRYCDHIKAINKLMVELMSLKNRAKLYVVTSKIPIRLHEIRWAGAMELALRFNEMKNDIRRASLPAETRKLFLTAEMEEEILEFSEIMKVCHTVSLYLQNSNGDECTMSGTRTLFDALMKKYPLLKDDIKTNS